MSKYGAEGLKKAMNSLLTQYGDEINEVAQEVVKQAGKEGAKISSQKSAGHRRTGSYIKGWTSAVETGKYGTVFVKVYNKTDWQLTHLLNDGFYSVRAGRRIEGDKHIDDAEVEINDMFVRLLEERLKQ